MKESASGAEREQFYTVDIEQFEGPLELLILLIKKKEIDIYNIPIAEIAEQYNRQLEIIEKRSLEEAGRYLPFLAELGLLKSRMLLPADEEEDGEDGLDPRMELARRLVVYERFRDAAIRMGDMSLLGRDVFSRGLEYADEFGGPQTETHIVASGIWPLVTSLCEMRARINRDEKEDLTFTIDPVSVEERMAQIHEKLRKQGGIDDFMMLFDERPSKSRLGVSFMAVLELAKKEVVELFQKRPFSSIKLLYREEKNDGQEQDKKSG